ncbi:hypothetical protein VTN77DRAFT_5407 [Rasamsonia byssochlamydoides]|uniref:uncharacterized protein n=1 Tax=Rasamsonia byssochlamydoides TaxID=89139 RepID=UPI0037436C9F
MLTPIRVRGRRNRSTSSKHDKEKKTAESDGDFHNNNRLNSQPSRPRRPKGRPMLSFELKSASQEKRAAATRPVAAAAASNITNPTKQRRKASLLECLPVELIEKIFLYALDINLPRASPTLAAAVSSERIYRVLILLAFWDDSESPQANDSYSQAVISRALRPADYVPLEDEERRHLQSSILRCRWCTLDRIRAQLPELMRMTVQKHWFGAGITMDEAQQGALTRFLDRKEDIRTFEGTGPGPNKKTYVLSIDPLVSVTIHCPEIGYRKTHRVLSVRTFPDKLLRGGGEEGFRDDDIACLEMLRHAYGFDASGGLDVSFSRDALQEGIHNALVQHNARALTTLLKIDEYFTRRRIENNTAANAAISSIDPDMRYYSLPAEHFRTAVRVAGHDPTFFQLLLRANAESLPFDDPDITQWAMDLESHHHHNNDKNNYSHAALGHWLLDFMTRLPRDIDAARANPREAAVFYLGAANRNVQMGRRYLDEVVPEVPELRSWMEEVSYDVSREWISGSGSGSGSGS